MIEASASGKYVNPAGEFIRDQRYITTRITADGAGRLPGRARPVPAGGQPGLPVGEPGDHRPPPARPGGRRCRWASAGPIHDERSWTFDLDPGGRDPVLGIERLQEAYFARFPDYARGHHRARRSWTSPPARS